MDREALVDGSGQAVEAASGGLFITEEELARRKAFLELADDDVRRLTTVNDVARRYADSVIDAFYEHLLRFEETRAFFGDPQVLQRVRTPRRSTSCA